MIVRNRGISAVQQARRSPRTLPDLSRSRNVHRSSFAIARKVSWKDLQVRWYDHSLFEEKKTGVTSTAWDEFWGGRENPDFASWMLETIRLNRPDARLARYFVAYYKGKPKAALFGSIVPSFNVAIFQTGPLKALVQMMVDIWERTGLGKEAGANLFPILALGNFWGDYNRFHINTKVDKNDRDDFVFEGDLLPQAMEALIIGVKQFMMRGYIDEHGQHRKISSSLFLNFLRNEVPENRPIITSAGYMQGAGREVFQRHGAQVFSGLPFMYLDGRSLQFRGERLPALLAMPHHALSIPVPPCKNAQGVVEIPSRVHAHSNVQIHLDWIEAMDVWMMNLRDSFVGRFPNRFARPEKGKRGPTTKEIVRDGAQVFPSRFGLLPLEEMLKLDQEWTKAKDTWLQNLAKHFIEKFPQEFTEETFPAELSQIPFAHLKELDEQGYTALLQKAPTILSVENLVALPPEELAKLEENTLPALFMKWPSFQGWWGEQLTQSTVLPDGTVVEAKYPGLIPELSERVTEMGEQYAKTGNALAGTEEWFWTIELEERAKGLQRDRDQLAERTDEIEKKRQESHHTAVSLLESLAVPLDLTGSNLNRTEILEGIAHSFETFAAITDLDADLGKNVPAWWKNLSHPQRQQGVEAAKILLEFYRSKVPLILEYVRSRSAYTNQIERYFSAPPAPALMAEMSENLRRQRELNHRFANLCSTISEECLFYFRASWMQAARTKKGKDFRPEEMTSEKLIRDFGEIATSLFDRGAVSGKKLNPADENRWRDVLASSGLAWTEQQGLLEFIRKEDRSGFDGASAELPGESRDGLWNLFLRIKGELGEIPASMMDLQARLVERDTPRKKAGKGQGEAGGEVSLNAAFLDALTKMPGPIQKFVEETAALKQAFADSVSGALIADKDPNDLANAMRQNAEPVQPDFLTRWQPQQVEIAETLTRIVSDIAKVRKKVTDVRKRIENNLGKYISGDKSTRSLRQAVEDRLASRRDKMTQGIIVTNRNERETWFERNPQWQEAMKLAAERQFRQAPWVDPKVLQHQIDQHVALSMANADTEYLRTAWRLRAAPDLFERAVQVNNRWGGYFETFRRAGKRKGIQGTEVMHQAHFDLTALRLAPWFTISQDRAELLHEIHGYPMEYMRPTNDIHGNRAFQVPCVQAVSLERDGDPEQRADIVFYLTENGAAAAKRLGQPPSNEGDTYALMAMESIRLAADLGVKLHLLSQTTYWHKRHRFGLTPGFTDMALIWNERYFPVAAQYALLRTVSEETMAKTLYFDLIPHLAYLDTEEGIGGNPEKGYTRGFLDAWQRAYGSRAARIFNF